MQNLNIKLRAYTFARVELIQMTTGDEEIPIFHIEGSRNIADLLTKYHDLSIDDLSTGSLWQRGYSWMHMDEESMNLSKYKDLRIDKKSTSEIITECFAEPFIPDDEEGKYSSHGIILEHFLSKCFDDDIDPDLDLELDDPALDDPDQHLYNQELDQGNIDKMKPPPPPPPPINMIRFGWEKGLSILNNVFWFCQNCLHCLEK